MPYPWVIFDADNTLFDYDRAEKSALQITFRAHGLELDHEIYQTYRQINRSIWTLFETGEVSSQHLRVQRFEELALAADLEYSAERISKEYLGHLAKEAALLPGALQLVEELFPKVSMVLATNGIADVQQSRIRISGIKRYFSAVVISDLIGVSKPSPEFFEEVFLRIGNPPKTQVLMVGDSLTSDIAGGNGYGIDTCWLDHAGRTIPLDIQPTYRIKNLQELYIILQEPCSA